MSDFDTSMLGMDPQQRFELQKRLLSVQQPSSFSAPNPYTKMMPSHQQDFVPKPMVVHQGDGQNPNRNINAMPPGYYEENIANIQDMAKMPVEFATMGLQELGRDAAILGSTVYTGLKTGDLDQALSAGTQMDRTASEALALPMKPSRLMELISTGIQEATESAVRTGNKWGIPEEATNFLTQAPIRVGMALGPLKGGLNVVFNPKFTIETTPKIENYFKDAKDIGSAAERWAIPAMAINMYLEANPEEKQKMNGLPLFMLMNKKISEEHKLLRQETGRIAVENLEKMDAVVKPVPGEYNGINMMLFKKDGTPIMDEGGFHQAGVQTVFDKERNSYIAVGSWLPDQFKNKQIGNLMYMGIADIAEQQNRNFSSDVTNTSPDAMRNWGADGTTGLGKRGYEVEQADGVLKDPYGKGTGIQGQDFTSAYTIRNEVEGAGGGEAGLAAVALKYGVPAAVILAATNDDEKAKMLVMASVGGKFAKDFKDAPGKYSSLLDKKERFPISDAEATIVPNPGVKYDMIKSEGRTPLVSDFMDHPKLYENYPQLAKMPIIENPQLGAVAEYDPHNKIMQVREFTPDLKEDIIHELTHSIQEKENFSKGTNPMTMANLFSDQISEMPAKGAELGDIAKFAEEKYLKTGGEEEARRMEAQSNVPQDQLVGNPYQGTDIADPKDLIHYNGSSIPMKIETIDGKKSYVPTDRQIEDIWKNSHYIMNDKHKSALVMMPPEEFSGLAIGGNSGIIRREVANMGGFKNEKLERSDIPYLIVQPNGKVIGHEGRHRSLLASQDGIQQIPVLIRSAGGIPWGKDTPLPKRLISEGGNDDFSFVDINNPIKLDRNTTPEEILNKIRGNTDVLVQTGGDNTLPQTRPVERNMGGDRQNYTYDVPDVPPTTVKDSMKYGVPLLAAAVILASDDEDKKGLGLVVGSTFFSKLKRAVESPKFPDKIKGQQLPGTLDKLGIKKAEITDTGMMELAKNPIVTRQEVLAQIESRSTTTGEHNFSTSMNYKRELDSLSEVKEEIRDEMMQEVMYQDNTFEVGSPDAVQDARNFINLHARSNFKHVSLENYPRLEPLIKDWIKNEEKFQEIFDKKNDATDQPKYKSHFDKDMEQLGADPDTYSERHVTLDIPVNSEYKIIPRSSRGGMLKDSKLWDIMGPDGNVKSGAFESKAAAQEHLERINGNSWFGEKKKWKDQHDEFSAVNNPAIRNITVVRDIGGKKVVHLIEQQVPNELKGKVVEVDGKKVRAKSMNLPEWLDEQKGYELGAKDLIAYAKSIGAEGVSWGPGQRTVDRWDGALGNIADEARYNPETKEFSVYKNGRKVDKVPEKIEPEKISDWIGQDPAKRLLESPDGQGSEITSYKVLRENGDLIGQPKTKKEADAIAYEDNLHTWIKSWPTAETYIDHLNDFNPEVIKQLKGYYTGQLASGCSTDIRRMMLKITDKVNNWQGETTPIDMDETFTTREQNWLRLAEVTPEDLLNVLVESSPEEFPVAPTKVEPIKTGHKGKRITDLKMNAVWPTRLYGDFKDVVKIPKKLEWVDSDNGKYILTKDYKYNIQEIHGRFRLMDINAQDLIGEYPTLEKAKEEAAMISSDSVGPRTLKWQPATKEMGFEPEDVAEGTEFYQDGELSYNLVPDALQEGNWLITDQDSNVLEPNKIFESKEEARKFVENKFGIKKELGEFNTKATIPAHLIKLSNGTFELAKTTREMPKWTEKPSRTMGYKHYNLGDMAIKETKNQGGYPEFGEKLYQLVGPEGDFLDTYGTLEEAKKKVEEKWMKENKPETGDPVVWFNENTPSEFPFYEGVTGVFSMLQDAVKRSGGGARGIAEVALKYGVPAALLAKFLAGDDDDRKKMIKMKPFNKLVPS